MAVPLPAGWIETGTTLTHTGSVTIQVAALSAEFGGEPIRVIGGGVFADSIYLGLEYDFPTTLCPSGWYTAATVKLYTRKFTEGMGSRVVETTTAGSCDPPYLAVVASRTVTGLRLAATVDVDTGSGETRYRTRLWADDDTVDTLTVGSKSVVVSHAAGEFITPSISVHHESVPFITGPAPADITNGIILAGVAWNAETDPTLFDMYPMDATVFPVSVTVWTFTTRPPLHYTANLRVEDASGATPPGLVQIGVDLVTNPGVAPITTWRWTSTAIRGELSGDWSADGVDLDAGEEVVPLRQLKPKAPQNSPQNWIPTEYELTSPLTVLLSTNIFSGTGLVVLSGTGNQTWTTAGLGATVTRALAATYDPSDGYLTTKHVAGEDVWGWGLYAYLEVDLSASANGDLTLALDWVAAGGSPITATKTYTLPVLSGTATYRVDLLFPIEGGPWYAERVSSMTFSGLVVGAYTLNGLTLVAVENAYVKVHARGNESGLVISQDGAFATGWWGDNPLIGGGPAREKDDESGLFDTGAGADTSAGGCVQMDGTLEDVALEWDRMEGMTVSYDATDIDADLTDGTNVCGTEDELTAVPLTYSARWYHTQMSLRSAPNDATGLDASLYMDGGADLCPVPAGTIVLPFRHTLGMILEAQCKDSVTSQRAGANAPVYARRSTTGAPVPADTLMASGVTDASGFASVAIRNGTVASADIYVALLGS